MRKKEGGSPASLEWQAIWDLVEAAAGETMPSRNQATYSSIKRMILAGQLGPGR